MSIKIPNINKDDYVIVATSGGPDSMALLDMIKDCDFNIVVANVNYKTRKESDLEQEEVGKYATSHNMIYESRVAIGYEKGNFEAWARDFRYYFFKELYDKYHAKYLFVAHNLDDFIETYYIQQERKIVTRFYGINYVTEIFGMNVCRPVLNIEKKALEQYCIDHDVFYSIDSTNLEDDYLRNRIRHNVVSKMDSEEKRKMYDYIMEKNSFLKIKFDDVDVLYDKYVVDDILNVEFINDKYSDLVLFKFLKMKHMSLPRIKDIIKKLNSRANIVIELDDEYSLVKEYNLIKKMKIYDVNYEYKIEGLEYLDTEYFYVSDVGDGKHRLLVNHSDFPLTIRNAREDDVVYMKHGTKKINRIFIDSKVGIESRKKWPVVVNKDGIILLVSGLTKNYNYSNSKGDYDVELFVYEKEH